MPIEHILGYIGLLWSDAMNICTAFAKALNYWTQIEHNERYLSLYLGQTGGGAGKNAFGAS